MDHTDISILTQSRVKISPLPAAHVRPIAHWSHPPTFRWPGAIAKTSKTRSLFFSFPSHKFGPSKGFNVLPTTFASWIVRPKMNASDSWLPMDTVVTFRLSLSTFRRSNVSSESWLHVTVQSILLYLKMKIKQGTIRYTCLTKKNRICNWHSHWLTTTQAPPSTSSASFLEHRRTGRKCARKGKLCSKPSSTRGVGAWCYS